ncbi:MAG: RelA/SpoT family protein [Elusimicrobiota bacterium]|jgi:GTP pyrophosphokinase|nr:RelA/SpoT family protein [Elusimicrobiota bacterium]
MDDKLRQSLSYLSQEDMKLVNKAFEYASLAHSYQTRVSGVPYLEHLLSVTHNLAELKMDAATIAAGLLHDILEDTLVVEKELLEDFGEEIVTLVKSVTKLNKYQFDDIITAQAENWRKMLLAVVKDIRVIIIKLADRLHNMKTLKSLPLDKQKIIAGESLTLYAPFAHRFGIYKWKNEIEDLAFEILFPAEFNDIKMQWDRRSESNIKNLLEVEEQLQKILKSANIPFRIFARPKNLYGIYKKMERQKKPFSAIEDLFGMRVITQTIDQCYEILSLVNENFTPIEGSFTDYIHIPKANMYQSLHITIASDKNSIVETQIRTEEMHQKAEYGIAAHWRYKRAAEGDLSGAKKDIKNISAEDKLDWLKQFLQWQRESADSVEFLDSLKSECNFEQIFVFTPLKKVVKLPLDSTTLDFAYAIHSDIGDSFMGAKVNNKMASINTKLKTGDICEIITRKNIKPTSNWLDYAVTTQARSRIRKFLREQTPSLKPAK